MDRTQKVLLYGSDLVVSIVGASLRGRSSFDLSQIDPLLPDAMQRLEGAQPDVVVFDLGSTRPEFATAALRMIPGLLLIGVDLSTDKMLVMSGEESRLVTTDDLVRMIESGRSRT